MEDNIRRSRFINGQPTLDTDLRLTQVVYRMTTIVEETRLCGDQ